MIDDCGCCTTPPAPIPAEIANRPGLSAIAYRLGTFATFRKSILDELSHTPELAGLTARISDDYTISSVELWSAVADVLTFYEERIANEAFLRTATVRDSVLRLVRLLDYQLRPGAAATTQLAFTLDTGAAALIPAGTRVVSIPAEGQKAQTFETIAPVAADARFNTLRIVPAPVPVKPTSAGSGGAIAAPDPEALATVGSLAPGDQVLIYAPSALETLTVHQIQPVDDQLKVSWAIPISGSGFIAAADAATPSTRAFKLGRAFHVFGFDSPPAAVVSELKNSSDPTTAYLANAITDFALAAGDDVALDTRYPGLKAGAIVLAVATVGAVTTARPLAVDGVTESAVTQTATTTTALHTAVAIKSGTVTSIHLAAMGAGTLTDLRSAGGDVRNIRLYELVGPALRFWPFTYPEVLASSDVFVPGRRAAWSSIEVGRTVEKGVAKHGLALDLSNIGPGRPLLLKDSVGGAPVTATVAGAMLLGQGVSFAPTYTDSLAIEQLGLGADQATQVTALVSHVFTGNVDLTGTRRELNVTIGSLPTQTITLDPLIVGGGQPVNVAKALEAAIRAALPGAPTFAHAISWLIDGAIAVASGVPGDPIVFEPSANDPATVVALGVAPAAARFIDGVVSAPVTPLIGTAVNGSVRVTIGSEPATDKAIAITILSTIWLAWKLRSAFGVNTRVTDDDRVLVLPPIPERDQRAFLRLSLNLDQPLALDSATATLLGNVAPASHGETVRAEVVGDGDSSQAFQRFPLKKKPVTFVPSASSGGVTSSLQLLVDGVRWKERSSLYAASPRDPVFITRIADDGALSVIGGDGTMGARFPTGRQNLVATYRNGIGLAGRVDAGKLTNLLDRPTGVKGATNPLPADGGADPETLDRAREAAPGTVRTFGRAVSIRDFEDTALMAGEVAKASATYVWTGERRAIHLTVAGQMGGRFTADGLKKLAATLAAERDPNHRLLIDNYSPVAVLVDASLIVDDRYVAAQVLRAARSALLTALSFDARSLAQPVYLSDMYRLLQNVEGVTAVDVNALDLKSSNATFRAAHGLDPAQGHLQSHLLMLPARPAGSTGIVLTAELAIVEVPAEDVTLRTSGGLSQ